MHVCRHHSPAGWLLQRQVLSLSPCRSLPASECSSEATPVDRHPSPAGWLLQRQVLSLSPVGDKPASECSSEATPVDRHPSPAGWLLQGLVLSFSPCRRQACKRIFACGDERLPPPFASRLAPTKTSPVAFPCRSLPASECSSKATPVHRHHSPAGWLLQRLALSFSPCRKQACKRIFACGDARLPPPFASRLAPTKTKTWLPPCRKQACKRIFA